MVVWLRGVFWPAWWDGPPIAHFLKEAAEGFPHNSSVQETLHGAWEDILGSGDVQARATRVIRAALHRPALEALLSWRLPRLVSADEIYPYICIYTIYARVCVYEWVYAYASTCV